MPGYNKKYFYISEFFAKKMLGAKIVSVFCPIDNSYYKNPGPSYEAVVVFDNGFSLAWYEDSEGPSGMSLGKERLKINSG